MAEIKAGFFVECDELLAELETSLLALKQKGSDPELINTVFRAAHSIKGGAASFGLDRLVGFAHRMEAALAAIRSGERTLDARIVDVLLKASDILADHVRAARDDTHARSDGLIEHELYALSGKRGRQSDSRDREPDDLAFVPIAAEPQAPGADSTWTIRFRPFGSLYANANEPLVLIRELQRLGAIQVAFDDEELPLISDMHPEEGYLQWTITLKSVHSEREIADVFEFVDGYCDVEISNSSAEKNADSTSAPRAEADAGSKSTEVSTSASAPAASSNRLTETIRVDVERVDRLVNLASELVINQAMLAQRLSASGIIAVLGADHPLDEIDHLTRELQDSVMAIRAQSVRVVFQRLSRLVRELEAVTGKDVELVTEGESTEVDRTVIERLMDPLTHMIRNAIDHGIETPEARTAAGKPAHGTLRLSAAHRGGRVVIDISDDGNGLNRERIRSVALSRGLIAADAVLSESDIDNLIFLPGFSTVENVSQLSGRGVGMDVVKRGVQSLGGRISVESRPGKGSTFTLSLPLTLAVLDGMLISICGQSLIVPLTSLLETIQPQADDFRAIGTTATLLNIRGTLVPLIDLGTELGYRKTPPPPSSVVLVVEDDAMRQAALLVDDVLGQRQVVIKSIQANYQAIDGIAAATILGDGRVALIADVNAILLSHKNRPAERRVAAG